MTHLTLHGEEKKAFLWAAIMEHAPFQLYIHTANNKDRDLLDLFENGVKYTYEGKTWHVQFGIQYNGDDSIANLFARCHSDKQIRGYCFKSLSERNYSDTRIKYNLEPRPLISKGQSEEGGVDKAIPLPFKLCHIIQDGERSDEADVPRVFADAETRRQCAAFFQACPELDPPYFDRAPQDPNEPTQSPPSGTSRSYWKWAVASSLFVIAAVYLVVKYHSQESTQTPMKSSI